MHRDPITWSSIPGPVFLLTPDRIKRGNVQVHMLAWDAFLAGTEVEKLQGIYGARQYLLKDAFPRAMFTAWGLRPHGNSM